MDEKDEKDEKESAGRLRGKSTDAGKRLFSPRSADRPDSSEEVNISISDFSVRIIAGYRFIISVYQRTGEHKHMYKSLQICLVPHAMQMDSATDAGQNLTHGCRPEQTSSTVLPVSETRYSSQLSHTPKIQKEWDWADYNKPTAPIRVLAKLVRPSSFLLSLVADLWLNVCGRVSLFSLPSQDACVTVSELNPASECWNHLKLLRRRFSSLPPSPVLFQRSITNSPSRVTRSSRRLL